jgi:hypothetical protein
LVDVSYDPLFDSAWAKWAQGVRHAHALGDDIDAFHSKRNRAPILEAKTKYDAKRHGFVITAVNVEPVPPLWSLILGDAANNFRSALDHLAWALVSRGHTPPHVLNDRQEKSVYFPIYEDRSRYNASLSGKLPGVRRADLAKVRRHQPYHQGARSRPIHVLVMLANINSGDKHRTIQPIWVEPSAIRLHISKSQDCKVGELRTNRWRKKPLETHTQLAFIPARRTGPDPQIQVQVNVTAEPSVGSRVTFQEWGTRTAAFLSVVLAEFSDPPQKLIEPIADVGRLVATAEALEIPDGKP